MIDLRKHQAFGPLEQPSRAGFNALSLSMNDFIPVANATERAQVVSDLNAQGHGPTTARPVMVYRVDAPAGEKMEISTDGTTWDRFRSGAPSSWVDLTLGSGWTKLPDSYAPPASVHLDGWWAHPRGLIRTGGSTAAGTLVATIPPSLGLRPLFTHHTTVASQDGYVTLSVAANGEIRIARNSGGAFLTTHWLDLTMLTWPVA